MGAFSTTPLGTRLPNLDSAVVALMLAGTFSMAPARAEPAEAFAAATIDELKIAYLGCSRSAQLRESANACALQLDFAELQLLRQA